MTLYVVCKDRYDEGGTEPVVVFEDKDRAEKFAEQQNAVEYGGCFSWTVNEIPFER